MTVYVDRDSVHMGDDMESHELVFDVPRRVALSIVLEEAQPYVHVHGGASWVVDVDGRTTAIWSQQHGLQLLVRDAPMGQRFYKVYFHYFGQIDPEWLFQRLRDGAPPHRRHLEEEYRPLAEAACEREHRRREQEIPERLLSEPCVRALAELGAVIDLHNDGLFRFDLDDRRWIVERDDSMTIIRTPADEGFDAAICPTAFAECWLVAAAAGEARATRGLPHLPAYTQNPAPDLEPMSSPPGTRCWTTTTPELVAQLTGERAVDYFRLAIGRSIEELVALLTPPR